MLHSGFVLFLLRSHSYAVTRVKLWHVSTNSLGSKKYGYLIFHLRFWIYFWPWSCSIFAEQKWWRTSSAGNFSAAKWQMSNVRLRNWASTAFDSFHGLFAVFSGKRQPHCVLILPNRQVSVGNGSQNNSIQNELLGVFCCQMPADVNVSDAWTHQKNAKNTQQKSAPKIIGK